jgi:hypothetical protein
VAWVAGRKDVLALLFISAALFVHTRDRRHGGVTVPLLLALAMMSKGVAIAGPTFLRRTQAAEAPCERRLLCEHADPDRREAHCARESAALTFVTVFASQKRFNRHAISPRRAAHRGPIEASTVLAGRRRWSAER